jgi:hypothetical protein
MFTSFQGGEGMGSDMECACSSGHCMLNVSGRERRYSTQLQYTGTKPKYCANDFRDGKIMALESGGDREEDREEKRQPYGAVPNPQ